MLKVKIKYALFLIFFPNLFFIALSYKYDFFRPLINIDYFLAFGFFVFNFWFISFYFVLFFIEFFLIINQIYPIYYINELLVLIFDVSKFPIFVVLKILFIFVFLIIFSIVFFRFYKMKIFSLNEKIFNLIIFIFFFIVFSLLNLSNDNFFINSQFNSFVKKRNDYIANQNNYNFKFNSPIYDGIIEDYKSEKKILLILNESYGYFKFNKINDDILESILEKQKKLEDFKRGNFLYKGVTIGGEFRELCNRNSRGVDFNSLKEAYKDCIPLILKKNGFETLSVHGGDENFYKRNQWYPKVGFSKVYFDKDFPNFKTCKAFNGKCDSDLINFISAMLAQDSKKFIYWLTINTHEPYDEKIINENRIRCSTYNLRDDSLVCKNIKLQAQFFDQLSESIENSSFRGVHIYIVGDHPPPIWDRGEKEKYLEEGVSWISFKIK